MPFKMRLNCPYHWLGIVKYILMKTESLYMEELLRHFITQLVMYQSSNTIIKPMSGQMEVGLLYPQRIRVRSMTKIWPFNNLAHIDFNQMKLKSSWSLLAKEKLALAF